MRIFRSGKLDFGAEIIQYSRLISDGDGFIEVNGGIPVTEIRYYEENPDDISTTFLYVKGRGEPLVINASMPDFEVIYVTAYLGYMKNQKRIHGKG
jgi:hypothetical protein